MPRFRCMRCGQPPQYLEFEDDNGEGKCPKCGRKLFDGPLTVIPLVTTHFIVMGSGPIYGAWGHQHIACEPKRDCLARHIHDSFSASDDARIVSCRACQATPAWQEMARFLAETDAAWRVQLARMGKS